MFCSYINDLCTVSTFDDRYYRNFGLVLIALLLLLKVLVVSDIKKDLGYTGSSSGHKAWREVGFYLHFPAVMF